MTTTHSKESPLDTLEAALDLYLNKKLPSLPTNIKELIVKFAPWVDLVLVIMTLPAVLVLLGLTSILTPFAMFGNMMEYGAMSAAYGGFFVTGIVGGVFLLLPLICKAIALPGLFEKKASGWRWSYYAALFNAVGAILSFNIGSIFGAAVVFYFLFQIRSYYKGLPPISHVISSHP